MSDVPDPKEPKGWEDDWRLAFPERFLKHQHLRGRDVTLTISRVVIPALDMVQPGQRPKRERRMTISFKELEGRDDIPNIWLPAKTCCRMIEILHGKAPKNWPGKRITVYPDPTVMKGKEVVGGIRVRSKITERSQRAAADASIPPTRESAPPAGAAPEITPEEMEEISRREREEAERQ